MPGRLAAHLLFLSEQRLGRDDLELDMPKGQLAGLLGTIPETLSRIITKMVKQGFIESDGRLMKIMDRQGLIELAEGTKRL